MSALWLPCTQMQALEHTPPLEIVKGEGSYLFDKHSKCYLDMISSWWVNLHGHCHPYINAKIKTQLDTLEHTLIAGVTHPPIIQLAEKLVGITPKPLTKAFFADSGSGAVEVALKMSLQAWQQQGFHKKTKFISLEHGYHGETVGSLSVTDIPLFSKQYKDLIVSQIRVPSPAHIFKPHDMTAEQYEQQCLSDLENVLKQQAENVCAMIVEPLVQGATGMAMYSPNYLLGVAKLAEQYQIHVIYDEIAVGFGRTGTMFAVEQMLALANDNEKDTLCPDFICLSKGLTAGYLPMSCVMTTEAIYQTFYDEKVEKGFLHSHSFTGNPLACASALASLEIFERDNVIERNQTLIQAMADGLQSLIAQGLPIIHPRQTGMIVAFTLDFADVRGKALATACLEHGVMIRPIGNHVYLIPPYCTSIEQIKEVFEVLAQGIKALQNIQPTVENNNLNLP
ncbi:MULTISPECIES: adenosylmethionine--8-amino-7-oxononanoate transaminase [unclassified Moraxella]|uniref:adenosylmethionine--8-amino-7-oxononanoate transaminase n=1 Tax=unclassified Moraxella TaxID=2685852 RepID=UPI003AF8531A